MLPFLLLWVSLGFIGYFGVVAGKVTGKVKKHEYQISYARHSFCKGIFSGVDFLISRCPEIHIDYGFSFIIGIWHHVQLQKHAAAPYCALSPFPIPLPAPLGKPSAVNLKLLGIDPSLFRSLLAGP